MAKKTRFEIRGTKVVQARLQAYAKAFPVRAARALMSRSEHIMTISKDEYCPVEDGPLRGSGHVVKDPGRLRVFLGYGGPTGIGNVGKSNDKAVGYAIVQHESLDFNHTVGEAEFLRKPLSASAGTLAKDLAEDLKL